MEPYETLGVYPGVLIFAGAVPGQATGAISGTALPENVEWDGRFSMMPSGDNCIDDMV
jgi:hypothetical protein